MQTSNSLKLFLVLVLFTIWETHTVSGKRVSDNDEDDSTDSSTEALPNIRIKLNDDYRSTRYKTRPPPNFPQSSSSPQHLQSHHRPSSQNDHLPSSQNINPALLGNLGNNPYSLNGGLGGLGSLGGLQNLGGGVFSNNNFQNPYSSLLLQQQLGGGGVGLGGGAGIGGIGGIGGLGQNFGLGGLGGLGGLNGQDIYSQQSLLNPYSSLYLNSGLNSNLGFGGLGGNLGGLGGNLGGFGGNLGGVNPYLLGRSGLLGGGNVLAGNLLAQSLLNPYNSYSSINPYNTFPFSARFGIGRDTHRVNQQNSNLKDDDS